MVICLERGADLHTAQLMPLPLAVSCSSKIRIGLPFWGRMHDAGVSVSPGLKSTYAQTSLRPRRAYGPWFRLTWVVPEKGPSNGCVCVCVCAWCEILIESGFSWDRYKSRALPKCQYVSKHRRPTGSGSAIYRPQLASSEPSLQSSC